MLSKLIVAFDRRFGRWFYRMHCRVYRWTGGLIGHRSPAGRMLLLTTTGRKSGLRRTTPLLYKPEGERYVVVGSNGGRDQPPAWLLNLTAAPTVELQVGRRRGPARARVLADEEKAAIWPTLTGYYKGWGDYQQLTERQLHVVELVPEP